MIERKYHLLGPPDPGLLHFGERHDEGVCILQCKEGPITVVGSDGSHYLCETREIEEGTGRRRARVEVIMLRVRARTQRDGVICEPYAEFIYAPPHEEERAMNGAEVIGRASAPRPPEPLHVAGSPPLPQESHPSS